MKTLAVVPLVFLTVTCIFLNSVVSSHRDTSRNLVDVDVKNTAVALEVDVKNNTDDLDVKKTTVDFDVEVKNTTDGLDPDVKNTTDDLDVGVKNTTDDLDVGVKNTTDVLDGGVKNTSDLDINVKNTTDDVVGTISDAGGEVLSFVDQKLEMIYPVIQKFKSQITSDPFNVTSTWIGSDICQYKGFFCDSPPDNESAIAVASIDFNGLQLSAPSIEGFIDQLPDLALFHANSNNFGGILPSKIASLKYLNEFDISNNKFTGPFPAVLLNIPGLTFLDIRFNQFSGSIPPQIFKTLDALFLNDNEFAAALPETLGDTRIEYLSLANNKFSGPITGSLLRSMSTVTEALFLNNQLTGCVPYELGFLKEARVFDVGNNRLTGRLPASLRCLKKAEELNFSGNFLYGKVPERVCMLDNLANFSLSGNYFTHVGPICRILIKKGVLDVRNNCIPFLPSQRSAMDCAAFFAKPKYCPPQLLRSNLPCKFFH